MTLEEAIKELGKVENRIDIICYSELKEATRLGTEALKREQWNRLHPAYPEKGLLLGETEK